MMAESSEKSELLNAPYSVRQSGVVGQVIVDADGTIACWTCDDVLAAVLAGLLNRAAGVSFANNPSFLPTPALDSKKPPQVAL
jgi:hypothetical protein